MVGSGQRLGLSSLSRDCSFKSCIHQCIRVVTGVVQDVYHVEDFHCAHHGIQVVFYIS